MFFKKSFFKKMNNVNTQPPHVSLSCSVIAVVFGFVLLFCFVVLPALLLVCISAFLHEFLLDASSLTLLL